MDKGTCKIDGCPNVVRARGWCTRHYKAWLHGADLGPATDGRLKPVMECSIDGCSRRAKGRTWCGTHYRRWIVYGDPTFTKRPNYGSGRVTTGKNGYVRIWRPDHPLAMSDGYVLEHRLVAYEAGLDVVGKHVHHRNEDKADNSTSNLEALGPSEHAREHLRENNYVTNQYGTWPLHR